MAEFAKDPIAARTEARSLQFRFATKNTLPLPDYLIQKVSLLRAASISDSESIKSELWEGLENKLAYLVWPYPGETLDKFKQQIRGAEAAAR